MPVPQWEAGVGPLGDGDMLGAELGPGEEDSSHWQAVGSPAPIPARRELLGVGGNTEQGGVRPTLKFCLNSAVLQWSLSRRTCV